MYINYALLYSKGYFFRVRIIIYRKLVAMVALWQKWRCFAWLFFLPVLSFAPCQAKNQNRLLGDFTIFVIIMYNIFGSNSCFSDSYFLYKLNFQRGRIRPLYEVTPYFRWWCVLFRAYTPCGHTFRLGRASNCRGYALFCSDSSIAAWRVRTNVDVLYSIRRCLLFCVEDTMRRASFLI